MANEDGSIIEDLLCARNLIARGWGVEGVSALPRLTQLGSHGCRWDAVHLRNTCSSLLFSLFLLFHPPFLPPLGFQWDELILAITVCSCIWSPSLVGVYTSCGSRSNWVAATTCQSRTMKALVSRNLMSLMPNESVVVQVLKGSRWLCWGQRCSFVFFFIPPWFYTGIKQIRHLWIGLFGL